MQVMLLTVFWVLSRGSAVSWGVVGSPATVQLTEEEGEPRVYGNKLRHHSNLTPIDV